MAQSRVDSRFAPGQWEMSLQSNAISHWLGTNLDSALPQASGTTKPDSKAEGFRSDRRSMGIIFHISQQAMIETYNSAPVE